MNSLSILRSVTVGIALLFAVGLPVSALVGAAGSPEDRVELARWNFDSDSDCRDAEGWTSSTGRDSAGAPLEGGWGLVDDFYPDTAPCLWHPVVLHYPVPPNGPAAHTPSSTTNVDRDLVSPAGEGCLEIPADARAPLFEFSERGVLSEKAWVTVLARSCPRPETFSGGPRGEAAFGTTFFSSPCGGSRVYVDADVYLWAPPTADFDIAECGTDDRVIARFGSESTVGSPDAFTTLAADLSILAGQGPFQVVLRLRAIPEARVLPEDGCLEPALDALVGCGSAWSPVELDSFRLTVGA